MPKPDEKRNAKGQFKKGWRNSKVPGSGRKRGSTNLMNPSIKAALQVIRDQKGDAVLAAMERGLSARPPHSAPYLKLALEYSVGRPGPMAEPPPAGPGLTIYLGGVPLRAGTVMRDPLEERRALAAAEAEKAQAKRTLAPGASGELSEAARRILRVVAKATPEPTSPNGTAGHAPVAPEGNGHVQEATPADDEGFDVL